MGAAAERDLLDVHLYLRAHASDKVADRLLIAFSDAITSLQQWPERGSVPQTVVGVYNGAIRQLLIPPYRLLYRIAGDEVRILMFTDGRRDVAALVKERFSPPEG